VRHSVKTWLNLVLLGVALGRGYTLLQQRLARGRNRTRQWI
jgi:hypothetical protein